MTEKFITHYQKLNVKRDATNEEIIDSYNKILKKYNPEIETDEEKKKKYIKINQIVKISFETLIDKTKRKEHDDLISFIENDNLTEEIIKKSEQIDIDSKFEENETKNGLEQSKNKNYVDNIKKVIHEKVESFKNVNYKNDLSDTKNNKIRINFKYIFTFFLLTISTIVLLNKNSKELSIDEIVSLVGHKDSDKIEYSKIMDELIKPREKFNVHSYYDSFYVTSKEKGISLMHEKNGELTTIFFESGISEGYSPYKGELPLHLKFSYNMKEVDALLGSTIIDYGMHAQCHRKWFGDMMKEVVIFYDSEEHIKHIIVTKDNGCKLRN